MKYSVIFTGIVALSSDLVTRSNAATLYGNSTTVVVAAESGSETTSKGPKFPVTVSLYLKLEYSSNDDNHSSTRGRRARSGLL
jgi:hypothetical protein